MRVDHELADALRAAALHEVGKTHRTYNLWDRRRARWTDPTYRQYFWLYLTLPIFGLFVLAMTTHSLAKAADFEKAIDRLAFHAGIVTIIAGVSLLAWGMLVSSPAGAAIAGLPADDDDLLRRLERRQRIWSALAGALALFPGLALAGIQHLPAALLYALGNAGIFWACQRLGRRLVTFAAFASSHGSLLLPFLILAPNWLRDFVSDEAVLWATPFGWLDLALAGYVFGQSWWFPASAALAFAGFAAARPRLHLQLLDAAAPTAAPLPWLRSPGQASAMILGSAAALAEYRFRTREQSRPVSTAPVAQQPVEPPAAPTVAWPEPTRRISRLGMPMFLLGTRQRLLYDLCFRGKSQHALSEWLASAVFTVVVLFVFTSHSPLFWACAGAAFGTIHAARAVAAAFRWPLSFREATGLALCHAALFGAAGFALGAVVGAAKQVWNGQPVGNLLFDPQQAAAALGIAWTLAMSALCMFAPAHPKHGARITGVAAVLWLAWIAALLWAAYAAWAERSTFGMAAMFVGPTLLWCAYDAAYRRGRLDSPAETAPGG